MADRLAPAATRPWDRLPPVQLRSKRTFYAITFVMIAGMAVAAPTALAQAPQAQASPQPGVTPSPPKPATRPPVLQLPIACDPGVDCVVQNYVDISPATEPRDWHCGTRTYHGHNGIDFRLPSLAAQRRGVSVLAAADGVVKASRDGEPDISVRERGAGAVAGRECGNGVVIDHGGGWTTQYCHMARGSLLPRPGEKVKAGQAIGRVGLSGETEYPHLHFTLRSGERVVEPFAVDLAPGTCGAGSAGAWAPAAAAKLAYVQRSVLVAGFAGAPVDAAAVDEGSAGSPPPTASSAALVAFVRALGLRRGDVQRLTISGPDGATWITKAAEPLTGDKAQVLLSLGRTGPPGGFAPGSYAALYEVLENGSPVLSHTFSIVLAPGAR